MLILAGITISVALSDGGLIDTTKKAANMQRIAEMKTKIELIVTNWQVQKMLSDDVTVDDLKQALVDGGVTDSKDKITGSDGRYEVETKDGDIFEIIIDENGNIKVNLKGEGSDEDNNPGGETPEVTLEVNVIETTTNSIKVQATTNNLEGNTLTYSYKQAEETEYTVVKQNSSETSHSFVGLASNTNYNIKVELKNAEGTVLAQKVIDTKTNNPPIGTISQKGEITWNNGKASLELQSTEPTDVIQYQIGTNTGEWKDYTGPIGNLNNGDTVYAKVKGSSTETTILIVDSIAPTVTVQRGTVNTSSITAVVTARDDQSGMPTSPNYKYYIKKSSETNYPITPSYTGSNISNAFTGLKQGTSYDIKVTVTDVAGNEGTGFLNNVSTENVGGASDGLATGNITLGTVTWSNGLATVTLNTTTSFSIQYQTNSNTEGNWVTAGTTATVTGLHHGDTVYARLWDGTNSGSDASVSVIDDKIPQIATISFNPTTAKAGDIITAIVTLTDNESGIDLANSKYIFSNSSTPLGINDVSKYTGGNFASSTSLSIKGTSAGSWYLHVLSVDKAGNKIETISSGITITPAEDKLTPDDKGELITGENKPYEDETGKAIIPGGFCVVKDSTANPEDKNTVESGLVISDVAEDDLDNSKHGNQFVWIPVEDYSKFHLIEGYFSRRLQQYVRAEENPAREAGATIEAGNPLTNNSVAGSTESIAMYNSVKINKGFYIGRFEAGIAGKKDNVSLTTRTEADGTVKPLVQKGVGVWNAIPWGGTRTDISSSDQLPGDDTKPGAVVVARSLYPESDTIHNVISTLCYGVQWDAALNFIDPKYEKAEGNLTGFVANSTNKGNYGGSTGSIAVTGSNKAYQQKHIYDLAGNVEEWIMEAYKENKRSMRGGYFTSTGGSEPASIRGAHYPDRVQNLIRFSPSFIFVTIIH